MGYKKRIVCLANSFKPPAGRCFAGREVLENGFGNWIRPVSARPTGEVLLHEYRYENQTTPKLLDVIEIPLLNPDPRHHQTENHVIDEGRWAKVDTLSFGSLEKLQDKPATLWINSDHTKGDGYFDCISHAEGFRVKGFFDSHQARTVFRSDRSTIGAERELLDRLSSTAARTTI